MKIIVCVDDNMGMTFNKRRQSMDKKMRLDAMKYEVCYHRLWMNEYSYQMFCGADVSSVVIDFERAGNRNDEDSNIMVDENFLLMAHDRDYCFVENLPLASHAEKISEVILYKWNRKYPADTYFDLDIKDWKLVRTTEFSGISHDKITKEVYVNNEKVY